MTRGRIATLSAPPWLALAAGLALAAIVIAAAPRTALAQTAPDAPALDIAVTLDPPSVVLGERSRLTVVVRHAGELLISARPPATTGALEVIGADPPHTAPADPGGKAVTTFSYVLAGFDLGELQLPPLRVSWLRSDGASGSVEAAIPALTVRPTLFAGDSELRPLKSQASVAGAPPPWQRPAAAAVALMVASVAGVFGVRWVLARRRRTLPPDAQTAPAGPEDEARRRLSLLATARLLDERDFANYYGTISEVMRGYLQARFAFRAPALTTRELKSRMGRHGIDRWQARLLGGLLDRCDAAVYAHRFPDPASADHDLTVAFEIVELSRPKPAEEVA